MKRISDIIYNLSIKAKTTILITIIAIIAIALVVVIRTVQITEQTNAMIRDNLRTNANMTTGILQTVHIYTEWMLNVAASKPSVEAVLRENNAETARIAHEDLALFFSSIGDMDGTTYAYSNIHIYDRDLNIIASAICGLEEIDLSLPDFSENIRMAHAGQVYTSNAFCSCGMQLMQFLFTQPVFIDGELAGIVVILTNVNVFDYFLSGHSEYNYSFINVVDRTGVVFYSNREAYTGRHINELGIIEIFGEIPFDYLFEIRSAITGVYKMAYISRDTYLDWTFVNFVDIDDIENIFTLVFLSLLPTVIGVILTVAIFILVLDSSLSRLVTLAQTARDVSLGNLNVKQLEVKSNDEISQVTTAFYDVATKLKLLHSNFNIAKTALLNRDILYRLSDSRLVGIYADLFDITNGIINEFQEFFELINDPIIIVGRNLDVKYANSAIASSPDEYIGKHIDDFIKGMSEYLLPALESGKTCVESDFKAELRPGSIEDFEFTCVPFMVEGKIGGALILLTNITHIKQSERLRVEAEGASKAKSDFLSKMSHEMRTPMNAILGLSEIILNEDLSEKAKIHAKAISQSGNHLLSLINEILDISKIESGKFEITHRGYLFHSVVNDVISIIRARNDNPDLKFNVYMQDDIPNALIGDELRVRQVLLNVLSNALKYTESGYFSLDIRSENRDDEHISLIMTVKDTGIGIKPEGLDILFNEFTQLNDWSNSAVEGTGLGLAITKNLLELMGGAIEVESKYGVGSVFTIILPQKLQSASTPEVQSPLDFELSDETPTTKFTSPDSRILVVDDVDINLIVTEGLLQPYGVKLDMRTNGEAAIEAILNNDYDLVFMDQMMPGMDGVEAVKIIREMEHKKFSSLPIVALTANAIIGAREMFLENGFNDFISKPIESESLNKILLAHLPEGKILR